MYVHKYIHTCIYSLTHTIHTQYTHTSCLARCGTLTCCVTLLDLLLHVFVSCFAWCWVCCFMCCLVLGALLHVLLHAYSLPCLDETHTYTRTYIHIHAPHVRVSMYVCMCVYVLTAHYSLAQTQRPAVFTRTQNCERRSLSPNPNLQTLQSLLETPELTQRFAAQRKS